MPKIDEDGASANTDPATARIPFLISSAVQRFLNPSIRSFAVFPSDRDFEKYGEQGKMTRVTFMTLNEKSLYSAVSRYL